MKRLRVYSCSHGLSGSLENNDFDPKGSWAEMLAHKFNLEYINKSHVGGSNFHIFRNVYNDLEEITADDLVFVQWSHTDRSWARDQPTVMPLNKNKLSKTYFKYLHHDLQEINKVIGYTLILNNILDRFVFNFYEGSEYFKWSSIKTWPTISTLPNYLNINKRMLSHEIDGGKYPCFHFNLHGHRAVYQMYKPMLDGYIKNNT